MSSTHLSLHFHLVFATKGREPWIASAWAGRLHAYMGGIIREMEAVPGAIGGMPDHVHLLMGLRATHRLSDVMRDLKAASSHWVHESIGLGRFAWQEGYGAFTVSVSNRDKVAAYIASQEVHHQTRTFREEYLGFLYKHGVTFDERYVD